MKNQVLQQNLQDVENYERKRTKSLWQQLFTMWKTKWKALWQQCGKHVENAKSNAKSVFSAEPFCLGLRSCFRSCFSYGLRLGLSLRFCWLFWVIEKTVRFLADGIEWTGLSGQWTGF